MTKSVSSKALVFAMILCMMSMVEGRRTCGATCGGHRRAPRCYRPHRSLYDPLGGMISDIMMGVPTQLSRLMRQPSDGSPPRASWTPRYDLSQDAESGLVELTIEVPGFRMNDLQVELVNERTIKVKGARKVKQRGEEIEQAFTEIFDLGSDVDPEKLEAFLSAGILTVRAQKKESRVKIIAISRGEEEEEPPQENSFGSKAMAASGLRAMAAYDKQKGTIVKVESASGLRASTETKKT